MHGPRDRPTAIDAAAVEARARGVRFLLAHQGRDGSWRDFDTPAGEASSWPTACIAVALQRAGVTGGPLAGAARALVAAQGHDGGWGYHEAVPTDADSTAWALLFLAGVGGHEPACDRAVGCLLRHQDPTSGGFATYAEAGPIRRFMGVGRWLPFWGWCRPHTEVTAAAALALAAAAPARHGPVIDAAWRFVRARQRPNGAWGSYWWATPHYSTALAVALARRRHEQDVIAGAASWVRGPGADGGAFATALGLTVLAHAGGPPTAIEQASRRLVAGQQGDGGWPSEPVLRIPVPPDRDPDGAGRWRPIRFGPGIEVADQHRLFTTAACVAALAG